MFFLLISCLLLMGLWCFGMAMYRLWLLDYIDAYPPIELPEEQEQGQEEEEKEEEEPQLTKLGRPISEIRLSA